MTAVLAARDGNPLCRIAQPLPVIRQYSRLSLFVQLKKLVSNRRFKSTRRKEVCQKTSTLIGYSGRTIGREELTLVPTPAATETHRPIPHHEIVQALIETLGFRHIGVVHDEYAVSPDGMKAFGVLDLATEMEGCRFSIGLSQLA